MIETYEGSVYTLPFNSESDSFVDRWRQTNSLFDMKSPEKEMEF